MVETEKMEKDIPCQLDSSGSYTNNRQNRF